MNARKRIIAVLIDCMARSEQMPPYIEIACRADVSTSTAFEYIARMKRNGALVVRQFRIMEMSLSAEEARGLLA